MPESTFDGVYLHEDLFASAAAYAFHIAEGQPFLDGNKRTGLNAALVFLELNGRTVDDPGIGDTRANFGIELDEILEVFDSTSWLLAPPYQVH